MKYLICILYLSLIACASQVLDAEDVKVSRKAARAHCKFIGKVIGRVSTLSQTREDAMKDLKQTAAHKNMDYVQIAQVSDHGTSITGQGYNCNL